MVEGTFNLVFLQSFCPLTELNTNKITTIKMYINFTTSCFNLQNDKCNRIIVLVLRFFQNQTKVKSCYKVNQKME